MKPVPNTPQGSGQIMSMDAVFVSHYMAALENLQRTWMETDHSTVDASKFHLQVEYLIRLIPDREIQKKITTERGEIFEKFKDDGFDHPDVRAGMVVITHLIEFICNSFDLLHLDIVGPGTARQFRDVILEIPDLPAGQVGAEVSG